MNQMSTASTINPPAPNPAASERMLAILDKAAELNASDIHIRADQGVFVRASGKLRRLEVPAVSVDDVAAMITVTAKRHLPVIGEPPGHFEYSFEARNRSRYRTHAFLEEGRWAITIRVVPLQVPSFSQLRLPPIVKQYTEVKPGLILVTGPTGSGKSTTTAAILEFIASSHEVHIVSIEDPIEYRLHGDRACITQREVGRDAPDFTVGTIAAMREDPDVLFIGELRTPESIEAALSAAETGHMVISTFHTSTCVSTINRLIAAFPPDAQGAARERLADSLRGLMVQRLLPLVNGHGQVLATEAMVNNYSVKEHIRDPQKTRTLPKFLERSGDSGMHSFDQSLYQLLQGRLITPGTALASAESPGDFRRRFKIE